MPPKHQQNGTRKRVASSECDDCLELRQRCNELERINSEHEATIAQLQKSLGEAEMKANRFEKMYRNEWWDYSLNLPSLDDLESFGYDETESEASNVLSFLRSLRELADDMRRGKLIKKIDLTQHAVVVLEEELLPYWGQFVDALAEYKFVLDYRKADGFNLKIDDIGLPSSFLDMLGDALQQTHCNKLEFSSIDVVWEHVWSGCNFVIKCIQSNPTLQTLDWDLNSFGESSDMDLLYTTINNHTSLHHLSFCDCTRDYRTALSDIFRKLTSKSLRGLFLAGNYLSNLRPTDISRFLAANPRLKRLDLSRNPLSRQDIIYISDALKHNTNLRRLDIEDMDVELGNLSFVIFDDSSMNAAYATNHYCKIETTDSSDSFHMFNRYNHPKYNMRKKIYYVLSKRHQSRENASCFDSEGIDIKHLPNILAILKPYSEHYLEAGEFPTRKRESIEVEPLSIVYEIMRGWRMPELYNFLDKMDTSA